MGDPSASSCASTSPTATDWRPASEGPTLDTTDPALLREACEAVRISLYRAVMESERFSACRLPAAGGSSPGASSDSPRSLRRMRFLASSFFRWKKPTASSSFAFDFMARARTDGCLLDRSQEAPRPRTAPGPKDFETSLRLTTYSRFENCDRDAWCRRGFVGGQRQGARCRIVSLGWLHRAHFFSQCVRFRSVPALVTADL